MGSSIKIYHSFRIYYGIPVYVRWMPRQMWHNCGGVHVIFDTIYYKNENGEER